LHINCQAAGTILFKSNKERPKISPRYPPMSAIRERRVFARTWLLVSTTVERMNWTSLTEWLSLLIPTSPILMVVQGFSHISYGGYLSSKKRELADTLELLPQIVASGNIDLKKIIMKLTFFRICLLT
jgi:hypothetical protein